MMFLPLVLMAVLSVGPEVPLSTPVTDAAPFGRYSPRVASNGDGFLVVWSEEAAEIRAARADGDGEPIDRKAIVVGQGVGIYLSVASGGGDYVIAYNCADTSVCLARVDTESGTVAHTGRIANAYEADIASNESGFLVVYRATRGPHQQSTVLDAVRLRIDGTIEGTPFRVANSAGAPEVASNGEDYLVVFSTYTFLRSVVVDASEAVGQPQALTDAAPEQGPAAYSWSVDSDGVDYLVVWEHNRGVGGFGERTEVRMRTVVDGRPGPTRILPAQKAFGPRVTWMGERYLVAYTASELPASDTDDPRDVRAFTVTALAEDARPLVLAAAPGTAEAFGEAAFNGVSTLAVWLHVYRHRAIEVEGRLLRNGQVPVDSAPVVYSRAVTNQEHVAAARIGDRVVTAWSENRGPNQLQKVFVQRLDDGGRPPDGEGIPAAGSPRDQMHPALGGSALVWVETDPDPFTNPDAIPEGKVYVRFFNAGGELDPPILLGPALPFSRVSVAAAGSLHLVAWELAGNIVGMRVSPTSGPLEAEPFVIHDASRPARNPVVASDGADFFVAWNVEEYPDVCGICLPYFSVHATAVSRFGVVTKPPFEVGGAGATPPRLVWNGAEYALFAARLDDDGSSAFAQAFDEDGDAIGAARELPYDTMPLAATWLGDEFLVAFDHPQFPRWLLLLRLDRDLHVLGTLPVYSANRPQTSQAALAAAGDGSAVVAYTTTSAEERTSARAVARRVAEGAFVPRRRAVD